MEFICNKKSFKTIEEADKRASEINSQNGSKGNKTRLRSYRCKKCGKIHLTSMSKFLYSITKDVKSRNKHTEKMFVKQEAEFWEDRFNRQSKNHESKHRSLG